VRIKTVLATLVITAITAPSSAFDCGRSTKELARLRAEYKEYAAQTSKSGVTFDGLVEILDKIVKLKSEMRKANCKIPPRK
jgi:exopolyphosphatase/pppGpp-phosphohydrolase